MIYILWRVQLCRGTYDTITQWFISVPLQLSNWIGGRKPWVGIFCLIGVTWGDGSGTGTGGTFNWIEVGSSNVLQPLTTWMDVWKLQVHHFTSNWKDLRSLFITLERLPKDDTSVEGRVLWYLTDNQVIYDVYRKYSSTSVELLKMPITVQTRWIGDISSHWHL